MIPVDSVARCHELPYHPGVVTSSGARPTVHSVFLKAHGCCVDGLQGGNCVQWEQLIDAKLAQRGDILKVYPGAAPAKDPMHD